MFYPIRKAPFTVVTLVLLIISCFIFKRFIVSKYALFIYFWGYKIANFIVFFGITYIFAFIFIFPFFHHLFYIHLTSIFEICRTGRKKYKIGIRPTGFILTVWKLDRSRKKIASIFHKQFHETVLFSCQYFKKQDIVFSVDTWLLNNNRIKRLKKLGLKVELISYSKIRRTILGFITFFAYRSFKLWAEIEDARFYRISWTSNDAEKLIIDLYKPDTLHKK